MSEVSALQRAAAATRLASRDLCAASRVLRARSMDIRLVVDDSRRTRDAARAQFADR